MRTVSYLRNQHVQTFISQIKNEKLRELNDLFKVSHVKSLALLTTSPRMFLSPNSAPYVSLKIYMLFTLFLRIINSAFSQKIKKKCVTRNKLSSTVSKIKLECAFCIWQHDNESVSALILITTTVDLSCVLFKAFLPVLSCLFSTIVL